MTNPRVGVVILAYGAEPYLTDAVDAVLASTGIDVDLVVVDNGCTTDAVDLIKDRARVVRPAANLGYTGGCKLGAAETTGDYLAFVNSDAIVAPDALAKITAVAAEPGVGAAMGSIRLADSPDLINTAGNPLHIAGLSWAGGMNEPATAHAVRRAVPSLSGCCLVFAAPVWHRLDGYATEYFAYHEDTELSLRLWQLGYAPQYVPDAVVLHHYEFSRNDTKLYLIERNRLVTVLTTYQTRTLLLLSPALALAELGMVAAALAGGWIRPKARGWAWIWRQRGWIRARRRQLQSERTVRDRDLVPLLTARFDPSNVAAPPGVGIYNALTGAWWSLVRRAV